MENVLSDCLISIARHRIQNLTTLNYLIWEEEMALFTVAKLLFNYTASYYFGVLT